MLNCICEDCGQTVLLNTLASGSSGNKYVPSISWCTCSDRDTNPDKKISGLVVYKSEKIPNEVRKNMEKLRNSLKEKDNRIIELEKQLLNRGEICR